MAGRSPVLRRVQAALVVGLFGCGLFVLAGGFDQAVIWLFLGVLIVGETTRMWRVRSKDAELMDRRQAAGEGTAKWDPPMFALFGLGYLAEVVVGALDLRMGWSQPGWWLFGLGLAGYVAGTAGLGWAMACNPHFEKTARIQTARDHRVVQDGPYRYVRHPGYLFTIVGFVGSTPLLLMSWWALVPAAATISFVALRTALEDRMLREQLEGYSAYAERTRYRLVPGLW